jgi:hypothetical protein
VVRLEFGNARVNGKVIINARVLTGTDLLRKASKFQQSRFQGFAGFKVSGILRLEPKLGQSDSSPKWIGIAGVIPSGFSREGSRVQYDEWRWCTQDASGLKLLA